MKKILHSHLVPHAGNGYTPSLLQRLAMGGMLLLVLLSFALTNIQALFWQSSDWLVGAVLPAVVTTLTNKERTTVLAPVLTRATLLDAAAQMKAEHMAAEGYFAHYSPGGISPWFWFEQVGYTYAHAGENLAVHFSDSDEVVDAWMNSPSHRANIVNSNYTEIGIGIARGTYEGYETTFVVQLFGAPGIPAPLSFAAETPLLAIDKAVPVAATSGIAVATTSVATTSVVVLGIETYPEDNAPAAEVPPPVEVLAAAAPENDISIPANDFVPELKTVPPALLMSDTIATSTNLAPAPASLETPLSETSAPKMAQLATKPNTVLQYTYIVVGSLTALLLLISIIVGWQKRTLIQVWYGVGLLFIISLLFYVHVLVTSGAQVI